MSEHEAYRLWHRYWYVPDGQPRGWDYDVVPNGWVGDDDIVSLLANVGPGNLAEHIFTDCHLVGAARNASGSSTNEEVCLTRSEMQVAKSVVLRCRVPLMVAPILFPVPQI